MSGRYGNTEKVLRVTLFPPPGVGVPTTTVVLAADLTVPPEQAAAAAKQGGLFAVTDVFDVPAGTSTVAAGLLGAQRARAREEDEENMAVAYYYWIAVFRQISGHGLVLSDIPAPLTAEQLVEVLQQVALHPDYDAQTVQAFDRDGTSVRLAAGAVVRGGRPVGPRRGGGPN